MAAEGDLPEEPLMARSKPERVDSPVATDLSRPLRRPSGGRRATASCPSTTRRPRFASADGGPRPASSRAMILIGAAVSGR